ncbi:MAG: trypsin-like peptidase domain-containing protein [Bacteroidia bacterium]|nr:trypsin-like peptidase domain-containing protein [Bacteroidia bacterium]
MFIKSIEKVSEFTRSIHSITRTYGGKQIIPGSSTLFFVNEKGYAITCKHVIDLLTASDIVNKKHIEFKRERDKLPRDGKFKRNLKGLEIKYGYKEDTAIQIRNSFMNCVDSMSGFTWHVHPKHDLAILKFNDFKSIAYSNYATFSKDSTKIQQGKFLCRLGFPFPEFTNYKFNEAIDDIEWTKEGTINSPRFPLEGMITRHLAEEGKIYGIELSTPGLRGQSGGPLFDENGLVYGMQFSTKHLHLGFDLENKEILIEGKVKKINDYSFIHLGQCIHASTITDFLKEKNVNYYEE